MALDDLKIRVREDIDDISGIPFGDVAMAIMNSPGSFHRVIEIRGTFEFIDAEGFRE